LRAVVGGLLSVNGLAVLLSLGLALVSLSNPMAAMAQGTTAETASSASQTALGAALATGLACIGAGIAVGIAGAAAIGGITEKPEILGRTIIFVGLAEGIAIYGLIISFMILNR
jgi:V/A-type H+/Na+-transporting ATPase subunit K